MPQKEEIERRFRFHAVLSSEQAALYEDIRDKVIDLANFLDDAIPDCRELSLALTTLQEAQMWAISAIATNDYDPAE